MRNTLIWTFAASALVALLLLAAGSADQTSAASAAGPIPQINIDVEDDATPANTATSVGTLEACVEIINDGGLNADEDSADVIDVDVVAAGGGIPPVSGGSGGLFGLGFTLNFSSELQVTAVDQELLSDSKAGSGIFIAQSGGPFPATGSVTISQVQTGQPLADTAADGEGILARFSVEGVGAGLAALSLSAVGVLDINNDVYDITSINSELGSETTFIAVDLPCPQSADVAVTSVTTTADAAGTTGSPFNVLVDAGLSNDAGETVNVDITVDLNLPSDCSADTNPIDIVGHSLPDGASAMPQQGFSVTCSDPSFHDFTATVSAIIDDASFNESDPSNNSDTSASDTTAVSAEADLGVVSVGVSAASATVDVPFDVTATVTVQNNGPFDPANADITATLTLPTDCTTGSSNPQTAQDTSLAISVNTGVDLTWSVTCTDKSDHSFSAEASVAVDQEHVSDSTPGNDGPVASSPTIIPVFAEADVEVTSFTVTAPTTDQSAGVDFGVTVEATVRNNGPFGPVEVIPSVDLDLPDDCTASAVPATSTFSPNSGADEVIGGTFTISCTDPSTHVFSADVSVDFDELHVLDPDGGNNSMTEVDSAAVIAQAELEVVSVAIGVPTTLTAGEAFDVTVDAKLLNNGPFGPVDADATASLTLPPGCTSDPAGAQAANVSLPVSTETAMPQQTWSVTCSGIVSGDFTAEVALSAIHIEEETTDNNSANVSVLGVVTGPTATPTPTPAPTATATPTPTAVAGVTQLPTTGGSPTQGGGGGDWLAMLAAAALLSLIGATVLYGIRRHRIHNS